MKVFVNGRYYDADKTPVVLIFDNDAERLKCASNIKKMPQADRIRLYCTVHDEFPRRKIRALFDRIMKHLTKKKK